MTINEKIEILKNSKEFDFIKDIPTEQLWKLAFIMIWLQKSMGGEAE